MEKVTVIVPVFNAGPYLKQCLDSIVNQTHENLEIILIQDGSSDESALICETYKNQDNRIRLIHKKWGGSGVGSARNTALPLITGKYVLFVDNDDWLELNHIECLYELLKETDSDIAVGNFTEFIEEKQTFRFHLKADDYFEKCYTPEEWFTMQYDGRLAFSQCFTVPWCKLYKAKLFEHIVYPESEKVEDDLTTWKIYLMADKIAYINQSLYYHRKRETSVTRSVNMIHVFPLKSIEERVTILSYIGFDITNELRAYRWRLELHKKVYLESGQIQEYQKCLQKLLILEKWQAK